MGLCCIMPVIFSKLYATCFYWSAIHKCLDSEQVHRRRRAGEHVNVCTLCFWHVNERAEVHKCYRYAVVMSLSTI